MGPAAHETAGEVPQLRELDLELALVAAGALGEDVEDQGAAVEHPHPDELLEVALLARRERVVDEHHLGAGVRDDDADLFGLAAADEEPRIGTVAPTGDGGRHHDAGGLGQLLEFVEVFLLDRHAEPEPHQHGSPASARSIKHGGGHQSGMAGSTPPSGSSGDGSRTLRAGTMVEMACL